MSQYDLKFIKRNVLKYEMLDKLSQESKYLKLSSQFLPEQKQNVEKQTQHVSKCKSNI